MNKIKKFSSNHFIIKVPLGILKNRWIIGTLVTILIVAIGFYYFVGTPQYSMWQLKQATIHQDTDKAMRFINIDKLIDNVWPKFTSAMMTEATKQEDPFGMLGTMLGLGLIENMKPMLKEQIISGIKGTITGESDSENPDEESSLIVSREDMNKLKLKTSQGKTYILAPAEVTGDMEMRYIITRSTTGRFWQITDLEIDNWDKLFN